jgi:2-aminoadipate transaminase
MPVSHFDSNKIQIPQGSESMMATSKPLIKLTRGVPPPESFPTSQLSECAVAVLAKHGDVILQYGPSRGYAPLRTAIAQESGADEEQIIVGQGSLELLDLCARMLIEPGDIAYTEQPSYDRTLAVLRRVGAEVVGFPLEDDGPNVEVLESRLKGGDRPTLFYLVPDFQNPSGTVLSGPKRQRIVELAREYEFWLVEDIPYRRLRYRGEDLPTLREVAPEHVIQMSSFSKLICPGLRVGYVTLPDSLVNGVAKMAEDTYINPSFVNQAIIAEFMQRGWLAPQIAQLKNLYEPRLYATLQALETHFGDLATWRRPDGGFFVGMTLNADIQAERLLKAAQEANLALTDGRSFFADGEGDRFVRLPFCALTPDEIEEGIGRLARVVEQLATSA